MPSGPYSCFSLGAMAMSERLVATKQDANGTGGEPLRVLLVSTYELGRQPFGIASPCAWLKDAGASVTTLDLAVQSFDRQVACAADMIAFHLPMHTATRIAVELIPKVRELNPDACLCAYGLYAPMNARLLRELGVSVVIGGEFEEPLLAVFDALRRGQDPAATRGSASELVSLERQSFRVPDRRELPDATAYAYLIQPDGSHRTVGYTEATRGCKHLCRHCPIVPVYGGKFRVVQQDVVLEDIERQVEAGAQHITFGDPDFFNGPAHALAIVDQLHERFPHITYDVTIKIEHLVKQLDRLPRLRDTGCILVTSAVESVDEQILDRFDKRHSREDFVAVVDAFNNVGIHLNPTFVALTPWTSLNGYMSFLEEIFRLGLVGNVAPVQYAIRLLIPEGSKLLELPEVRDLVGPFDPESLAYPWANPDPRVDRLQEEIFELVQSGLAADRSRARIFRDVWRIAAERCGQLERAAEVYEMDDTNVVPQLSEPWYCCAEPTEQQLAPPV